MTPDEAERRIRELEEALHRKETEAAMYKESVHALLREFVPYTPVTEAEIEMILKEETGQPILELIEELEREQA